MKEDEDKEEKKGTRQANPSKSQKQSTYIMKKPFKYD